MVSCKHAWLEGCKSTFETSSHKSRIRLDFRSITFVQCSKQDLKVNEVTLRWDHFRAKIISRNRTGRKLTRYIFILFCTEKTNFSAGRIRYTAKISKSSKSLVWWRTRATCHNRVTPNKSKEFLKSPCFLDLNGLKISDLKSVCSEKFGL